MAIEINADRFYQRLKHLIENWTSQKSSVWSGVDAICIPHGSRSEDTTNYSKSAAIQLFLLGYEIPDSIILITKSGFWFMATEKKCKLLGDSLKGKDSAITFTGLVRTKDEGMNREHYNTLLGAIRKGSGSKIGSLFAKVEYKGDFIASWLSVVDLSQLEKIDIATPLGLFLSIKDEAELDLCRRAAILSNKIMKHGFVNKIENILENDVKIKHEDLSTEIEGIIFDPSKIGVKVAAEAVNSCFSPIVQSGGKYDIKVSAVSNGDLVSSDIILCSLGAKYKEYCANVSRTFLVDAPTKVESTYATLMALYDHCLEQMVIGKEYKDVYLAAKAFLTAKDPVLLTYLPKSLGFAIGLQFRDSTLLLNDKNTVKFAAGMVLNLSVGFHNVPLAAADKKGAGDAIQKLEQFSLLLADTVLISKDGPAEVLTKISRELGSVSYSVGKDDDEDGDEDGDEDEDEDAAEKIAKAALESGLRRSGRSAAERSATEQAAHQRAARQHELMMKKIADAQKRLKLSGSAQASSEEESTEAVDLSTYASSEDYPRDVLPNQVRVDLDKEALILPINGQPVPFHISTIKNITRPEEGQATEMRVNFYIPGSAATKDVPKNMQQLVVKYGDKYVFVKELTFRALNPRNLSQAYQQFQELRKRVKQRDQKMEQEKDLVIQQKLIKIKDQRIPRLQDLTMRPQISGRKCVGTIEAHQNGLRFTSTKSEQLDIMYTNIKHAIYQPCDRTTMVLVHFHLKDFIMIGKKKQKDVQFYTEVIDGSLNVDARHSGNYDPDELDEEQQEREMKKRLNIAFKEFCVKVEKVASHYGFSLQIDLPYRKSGFEGNVNKEMVFLQPTTHCLVNLTEVPAFVLPLADIEHAHFERVNYATKNFDITFIFRNYNVTPRTITAVDMKYMDTIQDWLNLVEITYTMGSRNMQWDPIMEAVRAEGDMFYLDTDEDGEKKPAGWLFLSMDDDEEEGAGQEEEEDDDSSFSGSGGEDDDSDDSEDSDDSDDDGDEYVDSDDEEEDEDDEDDEEDPKSWEELEREAAAADKKRAIEERDKARDDDRPRKAQKTGRR